MGLEENKILAQKAAALWATKDFDKLKEIYASDCIQHQQHHHTDFTISGIEALRKCMEEFLLSYPDYQERIQEQIAEGDKVVSILDCRSLTICWSGVIIDRIEQNKIKETWVWFKRI